MNLERTIKEYEKKTRDELIDAMRIESERVFSFLDIITEKNSEETFNWFIVLFSTATGADGLFDEKEHKFFVDATGINVSYEKLLDIIKKNTMEYSKEEIDAFIDEFGKVDAFAKESLVRFVLCFLLANGTLEKKEKEYLEKLFK